MRKSSNECQTKTNHAASAEGSSRCCSSMREVQRIMGDDLTLVSRSLDLPELQGEPEEVASKKALEAFRTIGGPVLVEDTSARVGQRGYFQVLQYVSLRSHAMHCTKGRSLGT